MPATRNRFVPDSLLYIEPEDTAGLTATAASTHQLNLNKLTAYWQSAGDIAVNQEFQIVIVVAAATHDSSQSYVVTARVDTLAAMGSPTVIATLPAITAPGTYYIAVTRELIAALEADPGYLDLNVTIGGSGTKLFTYSAYAAPFPR